MTHDEVRALLLLRASECVKYKGTSGVRAWCEAHGVNSAHVSEFVNGKRLPPADMLDKLGLEYRIEPKSRRRARKSDTSNRSEATC